MKGHSILNVRIDKRSLYRCLLDARNLDPKEVLWFSKLSDVA